MIKYLRTRIMQKRSLFVLAAIGLLALFLWPSFVAAVPLTTQNQFDRAWTLARDIGKYEFSTNVIQTMHPTLHVENVGRSPETTRMTADGMVDMPGETMEFNLRTQGGPREGIQIRMADGTSFGRAAAQAEWSELDDQSAAFTPGNDLMAFAVAAENVRVVEGGDGEGLDALTQARTANAATHYAFDINGLTYAQQMRVQMEQELARKGELPPGAQLDIVDQFVDMKAHGELWVNADGLPVYQVIHMKFAAEPGALDQVEAEIATTFSGWDKSTVNNRLFWVLPRLIDNPTILTEDPASLLPNIQTLTRRDLEAFGMTLGLTFLLAALGLLLIWYRKSPKLYASVALSVTFAMVASPLLQTSQVYAFSVQQEARQAEHEAQQAQANADEALETALTDNNFNPNIDPLADSSETAIMLPLVMNPASIPSGRPSDQPMNIQSAASHTTPGAVPDTTPLSATASAALQATCFITVTTDDCDGDGLTNGAELLKLGTDPNDVDSDGDRISDGVEVTGFDYGGQTWYLDPLNYDSNGDGQPETVECPELVNIDLDGNFDAASSGTACVDTDGDNTPDVFDFDNDGDGVPDVVDGSPNYVGSLSTTLQESINLNLAGYDADQTVVVEFQIRPEEVEHLWQTDNVLDWPDDDPAGTVRRMRDNTLGNSGQQRDGDMRLSPLLEITIPAPSSNSNNVAGSLPITAGLTLADVSASATLDDWLDRTVTDEYGVTINQDEDSGEIVAYVPLTVIQDKVGDTPVAWGARMPYRPDSGAIDWGAVHQTRLVWMISALTDYCDTTNIPTEGFQKFVNGQWVTYESDEELYDYWCSQSSNWRTNRPATVIQTYVEPFTLTGLSVTEHQSAKHAIVSQKDALTNSVDYEADLWQLANGLQQSFLPGQSFTDTSGSVGRFAIEEIKNRFDNGTATPTYANNVTELWGIANGQLDVLLDTSAADDVASLNQLVEENIPDVLDTYTTAQNDDLVTLLIAREDTLRSAVLENDTAVSASGQTVTVNLSNQFYRVYSSVNWAPYTYNGTTAKWETKNVYDYGEALETRLSNALSATEIASLLDGGDAFSNSTFAELGAISFAKSFYLTLNQGINRVVDVNGNLISDESVDDSAIALNAGEQSALRVIEDILVVMQSVMESGQTIELGDTIVANASSAVLTSKALILEEVGYNEIQLEDPLVEGLFSFANPAIKKVYSELRKRAFKIEDPGTEYSGKLKNSATALAVISAGFKMLGPEIGLTEREINITAASLDVAGAGLKALDAATALRFYLSDGGPYYFAEELTQMQRARASGAIVGLALESAVIVGITTYTILANDIAVGSLAFNSIIADAVGDFVVAVLSAALSATVVGSLVVATVALIDAIIALVCEATDVEEDSIVDKWVCGGISGAIAKGSTALVYEQYVTVDLEKEGRLTTSVNRPEVSGEDGIVAGATITFSLDVTSTLHLDNPEALIVRTSYLDGDGKLDRDRLRSIMRRSNFLYALQEDEADLDGLLNLYSRAEGDVNWPNNQALFTPSFAVTYENAGLNQTPAIYLTEAFNAATIECWGFIGADEDATCNERSLDDSIHSYLGSYFVFDVFPATIGDFLALEERRTDSYRLSWGNSSDLAFPIQADADGDGLRSKSYRGNDPDDGTPDADGDGLSDYWEVNNDTSPIDADIDGDGLNDYWETFYQTDPWRADTDGDGLQDGDEFFHSGAASPYVDDGTTWRGGWTIVYDYDSNGNRLETLVSADPSAADIDGDTLLDRAEFTYGYNPNIVSVLNVMSLDARIGTDATQTGVVGVDGTVTYTATVGNELDNRIAEGLLQVELPTDEVQATQVMDTLFAQETATIVDSVAAPSVGATTVTSVTVRAGAIIRQESDRVLWLNFNEGAGATVFQDDANSPLGPHNGTCSGDACPVAPLNDSGYVAFSSGDLVTVPDSVEFDLDRFTIRLDSSSRGTALRKGNVISMGYINIGGGNSENRVTVLQEDCTTVTTLSGRQIGSGEMTVTYGDETLILYENGLEARRTSTSLCADTGDILLGSDSFSGELGRVEIYNRALTADEILVQRPWLYLGSYTQTNNEIFALTDPNTDFVSAAYSCNDENYAEGGNTLASSSCPTEIDGPVGSAISFNRGTRHNEGLRLNPRSNPPLGSVDGTFTVSMWLNPRSRYTPDQDHLETYGQQVFGGERYALNTAQPSLSVIYKEDGLFSFLDGQRVMMRFGHEDGLGACEAISNVPLTENEWQFVTVTFDGAQFRLYIGDDLVDTFTSSSCNGEAPYMPLGNDFDNYILGRANATAVKLEGVELTEYEITPSQNTHDSVIRALKQGYQPQAQINQFNLYPFERFSRFDPTTIVESGNLWVVDPDNVGSLDGILQSSSLGPTWMVAPYDDVLSASQIKLGFNSVYFEVCHTVPEDAVGDFEIECSFDNRWYSTAGESEQPPTLGNLIWFEADPTNLPRFGSINHAFSASYTEPIEGSNSVNITFDMAGSITYKPFNNAFKGNVDELRVYNTALSPDAVALLLESSSRSVELPFDEAPGQALFADATDNGNTAACTGDACPDSGIPGRSNQALRFDAGIDDANSNDTVGDFVTLGSSDALGVTNNSEFTTMMWIKPDVVNTTQTLLGLSSSDELYLRLVNNQLTAQYGTGNSVSASPNLQANTWVHVAWQVDVDTDGGTSTQRLYINGASVGSASVGTTFATDSTLLLGAGNGQNFFDGLIDGFVVERYALTQAQIQAVINESPLVNLHFDEDSTSGSFSDDGNNGFDATCNFASDACPAAGDKGQMREATHFDGVNDRLTIPDADALDVSRLTLGLWLKPTDGQGDIRPLIAKGQRTSSQNQYHLYLNDDNSVSFGVRPGDDSSCEVITEVTSSTSLFGDVWNHVMATYDGESIVLYINGSNAGQVAVITAHSSLCPRGNNDVTIANGGFSDSSGTVRYFDGLMDELTIHASALSSSEVAATYDYQASWYDLTQSFPIIIDVDDPQVALDVYTDLANDPVLLGISAVDPTSDIDGVQVTITPPSGSAYTVSATQSEGSGPWMLIFTPAGQGDYAFSVVATDAVGRTGSDSKTITVDDTLPSATVDGSLTSSVISTNPVDGSQAEGGPANAQTLFGLVSDNRGISNTVSIDVRDYSDTSVQEMQEATVEGSNSSSTWTVDYPFGGPSYGSYSVFADMADAVGNVFTGTIGTISIDDLGPNADLTVTSDELITGTGLIQGTVSDLPYPKRNKVMHFHFEEADGATTYVDATLGRHLATCDGAACPTMLTDRLYGSAGFFSQADNLTIPADERLELGNATLMAWISPAVAANGDYTLLAADDGSTTGFRWQIAGDLQSMLLNNGTTTESVVVSNGNGSAVIDGDGSWSHVALVMEDGRWTGYVDGLSIGSVTQSFGTQSDLPLHIGSTAGSSDFFRGLLDELVVYNRALDSNDIYHIANPLATTVSQIEVQARHLNGAVWPNVYPEDLKLYLSFDGDEAATGTIDQSSLISGTVSCNVDAGLCPTAGVDGAFGNAVSFDGEDKVVVPDEAAFDINDEITLSAWIKVDSFNKAGANIVSKGLDTWRIVRTGETDTLSFITVNSSGDGDSLFGSTAVADGQWHHVVGIYDGINKTLYIDGVIDAQSTVAGDLNTNDLPVYVGATSEPAVDVDDSSGVGNIANRRFNGAIDEVAIFGRALSEDEVLALYTDSPWQTATLDSATSIYSTWQATLSNLEGLYDIRLRATDSVGNVSISDQVWSGTIDVRGPLATFQYVPINDNEAWVQCEATDLYITTDGWICPTSGQVESPTTKDWLTTYFSGTTRTETVSSDLALVASSDNASMTACDQVGNCTTLTRADVATDDITIITSPLNGEMLPGFESITISGYSRASSGLEELYLYVNGRPVGYEEYDDGVVNPLISLCNIDPQGQVFWGENGPTEAEWSFSWTPLRGVAEYDLEIYVRSGDALGGNTACDVFEGGVVRHGVIKAESETIVYPPTLAIEKSVMPEFVAASQDVITYTIVVTNDGTEDLTGVLITDTLPVELTGNDLSVVVDIAAGASVTETLVATVNTRPDGKVTNTAYVSHPTASLNASASYENCAGYELSVTNSEQFGSGSLRDAISNICSGGTIIFGADLTIGGQLQIDKNVTIDGSGYNVTRQSFTSIGNEFGVPSTEVVLKNLSIQAPLFGEQVPMELNADHVIFDGVTVFDTSEPATRIVALGSGHLTVRNSTFVGSGNVMISTDTDATLTVENSTFTGSDEGFGTAIRNQGVATVAYSTFVNVSNGIVNRSFASQNSVARTTISNSLIISNNTSDCSSVDNGESEFIDGGYNLFGTGGGCPTDSGTSQTVDPVTVFTSVVAALANNSGETQTHALLADSPALDAIPSGSSSCGTEITTDQRGVARPQNGACDIGAYEFSATSSNIAPVLDAIPAQSVTQGETVTFTATASDVNGDSLTFSLGGAPADATIDGVSGLFNWATDAADAAGIYTTTVIVSDGVLTDSQDVAITVTELNVAPILGAIPAQSVTQGETVTFTATASDANGDALTFSLGGAPAAATIDSVSGLFNWATDAADVAGIYTATIIVSDGVLTDSQDVAITVTELNVAPILGAIPAQSVTQGETVTFTATASDANGDALTFSLGDAPADATIDGVSGLFNWATDAADAAGIYTTTVIVSDGVLTDSQDVAITVTELNVAPILGAIPAQSVTQGETVTFTATASDANGDALTFSLGGAPAAATIDSVSGLFNWATDAADVAGIYTATIIVSDGVLTDSQDVAITVTELNVAPILGAIPAQSVTQGETVTFTATASDANGDALTFSLGGAPADATIDSVSGLFNWATDAADVAGIYTATIIVSDGVLTDSQDVAITVSLANVAPVAVDDGYATTMDAALTVDAPGVLANDSDVDGDALTAVLAGGPSNGTLTLNGDGSFSYTPNAGTVGDDSFTYVANDGTANSNIATVTVTVSLGNVAPVLDAIPAQSVVQGETVNFTATASDANGDTLTFSLSDAPADATIDGASGLFTWATDAADAAGLYTATVIVSDGVLTDSQSVDITVTALNVAPVATDDAYTTITDTTLDVTAPGVLANDTDTDGDTLTAALVSGPSNGTLTLNGDGSFSYTPNAGFTGGESFTYVANDGTEDSNVATVAITVDAVVTPFATCGGYDIFETSPGVYEAPSFPGNLIVGTDGKDLLNGTNGTDLILGLAGADDIYGRNGDDVICGGNGKDIIDGDRGNDTIYGEGGADWLIGSRDNDILYGGDGRDDLEGNNGQDTLYGEDGYDILLGGRDNDLLFGGNNRDDLYGNQGDDALNGGNGNDYCEGGLGNDTIDECEGASAAADGPIEDALVDLNAVRRGNDGEDSEHSIKHRPTELFLPLVASDQ